MECRKTGLGIHIYTERYFAKTYGQGRINRQINKELSREQVDAIKKQLEDKLMIGQEAETRQEDL